MKYFGPVFVVLVGVLCCVSQQAADLVIFNGDVRTMSDKRSRAEAIAVVGNKITAVGSNSDIRKLITGRTRIFDANGSLVIPGFNDSHVHFMAIGNKFSTLDLRGISDPETLYERLRHYSRYLPKGRWIIGSGGSDELWQQVSSELIDKETPENPLFIYHTDAKSALTNSRSTKIAGKANAQAGVVSGNDFQIIRRAIPQDHTRRWAEIAQTASNYISSFGITSVQDTDSDDHADLYRTLAKQGKLKVRIYDCHGLPKWKMYSDAGLKTADGNAMVRTGCLKGTADVDGNEIAKLRRDVIAADKAGMQVLLHAIGERQVGNAVDIFEAAFRANGPRDRRSRIEHAEGVLPEAIDRMKRVGIIASVQPHLFGNFTDDYQTLFSAKIPVALGSDAPMTEIDPFLAAGHQVSGIAFTNTLSAYTYGSAFAEKQEHVKGTIEPGKLADIVVFRQQKGLITGATNARSMTLVFSLVDGQEVYREN